MNEGQMFDLENITSILLQFFLRHFKEGCFNAINSGADEWWQSGSRPCPTSPAAETRGELVLPVIRAVTNESTTKGIIEVGWLSVKRNVM